MKIKQKLMEYKTRKLKSNKPSIKQKDFFKKSVKQINT